MVQMGPQAGAHLTSDDWRKGEDLADFSPTPAAAAAVATEPVAGRDAPTGVVAAGAPQSG
jgi:hypothetical protein